MKIPTPLYVTGELTGKLSNAPVGVNRFPMAVIVQTNSPDLIVKTGEFTQHLPTRVG
jgi:hypothetical protein